MSGRPPTTIEWMTALEQIRQLKMSLNMTRLIMPDKSTRDLTGEIVDDADKFLAEMKRLTQ